MVQPKQAFTLIELLVVVLIIGILVSVAVPGYKRVVTRVKNREAVIALRTIGRAIERYNLANGPLPEEKSGDFSILDITVKDSTNWSYYFYCYDEFKSCGIWAHPTREMAVGEHDYYLGLWLNKGVMQPEIQVKEHTLLSETKDENGVVTETTSSSGPASESICKQAGGRMTEEDGCVLE